MLTMHSPFFCFGIHMHSVINFLPVLDRFLALGELMEEIWEEVLVKETPGLTPFWVTTAIFSGFFIIIVLENVTPEVEA